MKKILSKLTLGAVLTVLTVVVALGGARPALAQDDGMKNLAVVSFFGYDELKADLDFIGSLAGNPGAAAQAEAFITLFTQGQGLAGLDKTKPLGAVVQSDGMAFNALVFVPVTDLQKLLDVLAAMNINAEEDADGVFEIQAGPQAIFVKAQGGWAFVSQSADALANLPANPLELLGDLPEQYDVAVRLNVQNIPEMFRQMAVGQLKLGVEDSFERLATEDDEAFEMRKKIVDAQVNGIVELIEQTDSLTIGWTIDAEAEKTFLDFSITALPGSKLAKQAAEAADTTSSFSGFVRSDGAITINGASKLAEDDIVQVVAMLATMRTQALQAIDEESDLPDDAVRDIVKSAVGDLLDVVTATVKEGRFDTGAVVILGPEGMTFAAGMLVADGKAVEGALKKLASLAENEPEFPGIKWDADEHGGVRFHTANIPIPAEEEEARQLLGDELDVVIGIGETSVYFALGADALSTLKDSIDKSKADENKQIAPFTMSVSLGKVMKFASPLVDDPNVALFAQELEGVDVNDHITITGRVIPNGLGYRLEVEQGVLRAIGKIGAAVGGAVPDGF